MSKYLILMIDEFKFGLIDWNWTYPKLKYNNFKCIKIHGKPFFMQVNKIAWIKFILIYSTCMIHFQSKQTLTQLDRPWFLFRELAAAPTNKSRIS